MAEVELKNVSKAFGNTRVLRDVDLAVADGEFMVLVGPSGCGKSTLLRAIAGLDELDTGDVIIGGTAVNDLPPAKRRIAMVFQSYALYPQMSVYDNMAFGLRRTGKNEAEVDSAVRDAAALLGIEQLLDRKPKALSGGQRQRVAIGRAIVRQPAVFLFDEPLSNLDAGLRVRMRYEFAKLHQRLKTTTIYVTHDQVEAMTLADRIAILDQGEVQQLGTPEDLYDRPANLFVAGFIGSPRMNFLPASLVQVAKSTATVELRDKSRIEAKVAPAPIEQGQPLTVGVRAEHLTPVASGSGIAATVTLIEWLGNMRFAYLTTQVSDEPLIMQMTGNEELHEGQSVNIGARAEDWHLFDSLGRAIARAPDRPGTLAA